MISGTNILRKRRKGHVESIQETLQLSLKNSMERVTGDIPRGQHHTVSPVAALDILGLECGATNEQLLEAYESKAVKGQDGEFVVEKINKQAFDVLAEFGTNHKASPDGFAHIIGCENPYVGHYIRPKLVRVR